MCYFCRCSLKMQLLWKYYLSVSLIFIELSFQTFISNCQGLDQLFKIISSLLKNNSIIHQFLQNIFNDIRKVSIIYLSKLQQQNQSQILKTLHYLLWGSGHCHTQSNTLSRKQFPDISKKQKLFRLPKKLQDEIIPSHKEIHQCDFQKSLFRYYTIEIKTVSK